MSAVLYTMARTAVDQAYAPYSRFLVGAALLTDNGFIITGVNVENAASPQGICAERSAIVTAVGQGHHRFTDIAIAYRDESGASVGGPIRPCGGCLSVLHEFNPEGTLRVHCLDANGNVGIKTLRELLPYPFVFRNTPAPTT
ncbi:MAG: cytidine deaminase [bacterium]